MNMPVEYIGRHRSADQIDRPASLADDSLHLPRHRPIFDINQGAWQIVAVKTPISGTAVIRFWRTGQMVRELLMPAYKVWNIAAHSDDIIADIEHGLALATS